MATAHIYLQALLKEGLSCNLAVNSVSFLSNVFVFLCKLDLTGPRRQLKLSGEFLQQVQQQYDN